jgi:hypothetical protein
MVRFPLLNTPVRILPSCHVAALRHLAPCHLARLKMRHVFLRHSVAERLPDSGADTPECCSKSMVTRTLTIFVLHRARNSSGEFQGGQEFQGVAEIWPDDRRAGGSWRARPAARTPALDTGKTPSQELTPARHRGELPVRPDT